MNTLLYHLTRMSFLPFASFQARLDRWKQVRISKTSSGAVQTEFESRRVSLAMDYYFLPEQSFLWRCVLRRYDSRKRSLASQLDKSEARFLYVEYDTLPAPLQPPAAVLHFLRNENLRWLDDECASTDFNGKARRLELVFQEHYDLVACALRGLASHLLPGAFLAFEYTEAAATAAFQWVMDIDADEAHHSSIRRAGAHFSEMPRSSHVPAV